MIVMLLWTYHVDCLIAALESVLYEREQYAILFVVAVEKRTDVTYVAELGTGKGNGRARSSSWDSTSPWISCRLALYSPSIGRTP